MTTEQKLSNYISLNSENISNNHWGNDKMA